MIVVAIGLGMLLSFLFAETTGIIAGGIVVAGYIALSLHHPGQVLSTIAFGILTFLIVNGLSNYILLYGRRLLLVSILIGYFIGYATRMFPPITITAMTIDISTIGFVVPGIMAYWIKRQGIVETIAAMTIVSILVRFIIIIITGGIVIP